MRSYSFRWFRVGLFLAVVLAVVATGTIALPAQASGSGVLKLKVQPCFGSTWLSDASVSVTIYRPGVGNVDSGGGTTDSVGYVEISFDDLADGDEAHVLVTPPGDAPGSNHTYYCLQPDERYPILFDIGVLGDDTCQDGWYDRTNNIILCLHG
jgi:hypothetical protein